METLSAPGILESIQRLMTPRARQMAREFQKLRGDGTPPDEAELEFAERWGGRSERAFRSAARLGQGNTESASHNLERLADIGWAERGLAIKCSACGISSFLRMSLVPERGPARCPGCHTVGTYTRDGQGLSLVYRLDSVIDRAYDQGVLPHLLAIAALNRRFTRSWFLPGVDLWFPDLDKKREADIFGIADAKILSGEVKATGAEFAKNNQVPDDIDIATRLKADVYVMASPTAIPAEAQAEATQLCQENGLELIVLEAEDLRA